MNGGINRIDPEDAVTTLMAKWLIKAFEPGMLNLHLFLHFTLSQYQPYSDGRWKNSLNYLTIQKYQAKRGSIVWNHVTPAWKALLPELQYIRPTSWEELMGCSWWWCPLALLIGPRFSKKRASILHKAGLKKYKDVWVQGRFMSAIEAQLRYGLLEQEYGAWEAAVRQLRTTWQDILCPQQGPIFGDWMAVFSDNFTDIPSLVCHTRDSFHPYAGPGLHLIPIKILIYTRGSHTFSREPDFSENEKVGEKKGTNGESLHCCGEHGE